MSKVTYNSLSSGQRATLKRAETILLNMVRESGDAMSSPEHVRKALQCRLGALDHEVFTVMFLDNRHNVISIDDMFNGTIDSAAVYPREVVKAALRHNAAAVVLAHNHPSGTPEPSDADVRLTRKLVDALSMVDIRVLDHLVVSVKQSVSLAERGLM